MRFHQISEVRVILPACPFNLAEMAICRVMDLSSLFGLESTLVSSGHTGDQFIYIIPGKMKSVLQTRECGYGAYQSSKIPVLRPTTTAYHFTLLAPGVETRRVGYVD
jgi:hypothetical protein